MTTPSYDVIVIGAGPAGLSAATEAAKAGLRTLCLDKLAPGGALINLTALHDYPGGADGPTVSAELAEAATDAGVELGFGEVVTVAGGEPWRVDTAEGEHHTARAIVVATGLAKGKLGLPEEEAFEGRGLSHCASCDGPLYAGEPVVVAGAAGWAPHEAVELKGFVGEVTMVAEAPARVPDGIGLIAGRIVGLEGSDGLQSVVVESGGMRKSIPARAVFVYEGQSPAAEFLPDSLARDATGHIVVDDGGRASAPAAFAAGDVRAGARSHLADAIADGQRAGEAVVKALKGVTPSAARGL
ncbi:NAD(P)/FAD-dependent oxidoreductase [Reyranella sp.]|uniref:NAD(P)/FAD-dependent oxidoreductase n=1 Tax=Reyranella sp. TaxID=1929291 RepID=UPI003BAB8F22